MCQNRKSIICISQDCRWGKSPLSFCSIPSSLYFASSQFCHSAGGLVLFHESFIETEDCLKEPGLHNSSYWAALHICCARARTHLQYAHAHYMLNISSYTHTHISRLSLKSQDFPPQPFWSDIIPLSVKDCSSAIFPPSSFSSASSGRSRCRSCTYSDSTLLCCFHDNSGREHYPEGFSQWW